MPKTQMNSSIITRVATLLGLIAFWPLLTQLYWPATWPLDAVDHAVGRDFVNMWVGGRLLWEGHWPVLFDVSAYQEALHRLMHPRLAPHVWSYPPTSFLVAAPLALLPYGAALLVWTLAGLLALLAVARIGLPKGDARQVMLLTLLAPATFLNVICGQNGFFTAALLGGGVLLLERRPILAGVLIGLLSYKPQFGLVIAPVLLVLGAWRAIAAAAITAVAMALVALLIYGPGPWFAFVDRTLPLQGELLRGFNGFFTTMLVSPYASLRHIGLSHAPAMALQVLLGLAVVGACAWAVRRTRDGDVRLALIASATFLVTPYALTYDLPIFALLMARQIVRAPARVWSTSETIAYGAAWALPLASAPLVMLGLPLAPLVTSAVFFIFMKDLMPMAHLTTAPGASQMTQPAGRE